MLKKQILQIVIFLHHLIKTILLLPVQLLFLARLNIISIRNENIQLGSKIKKDFNMGFIYLQLLLPILYYQKIHFVMIMVIV